MGRTSNFFQWTPLPSAYHSKYCIMVKLAGTEVISVCWRERKKRGKRGLGSQGGSSHTQLLPASLPPGGEEISAK